MEESREGRRLVEIEHKRGKTYVYAVPSGKLIAIIS